MTIIVTGVKTKKELREHPERADFSDPSLHNAMNGGSYFDLDDVKELCVDEARYITFTCTNHPKRSWFAIIQVDETGEVVIK